MSPESPYVITISRQLGSGGAELGQRLAKRLGLAYVDREILRQAAEKLRTSEENLELRDERVCSIWQSLISSFVPGVMDVGYMPPYEVMPTDRDVFEAESDIIRKVARMQNSVIVGRGGFHVLRGHPRLLSILLHADMAFRCPRIQELFKLSAEKAIAMIQENDRARTKYARALTGRDWTDLRQFHLTIDTGAVGMDAAEEAVVACLHGRVGEL
jgi:cytidylate kinase